MGPVSWRLGAAVVAIVSTALVHSAHAADLDSLQSLGQGEFRRLSEDLGAALSYKPLIPAEALGVIGFDVGVAVSATRLDSIEAWRRATNDNGLDATLPLVTLRAHKGLPFNIDIGAMVAGIPDSNVRLYGGELRWAVLPGSVALPAVAVRGSFTRLSGVDQLEFDTKAIDVSVSKGILMFTPYAGIGQVWSRATPRGVPLLARESFSQSRVFAGVNINLGVNLAVEVDSTGGIPSFGMKIGARF